MAKKDQSRASEGPCFLGSTVLGERGQIVIPKEARELYDMKPGDSMMVMAVHNQAIALVPVKKAQALMKAVNDQISEAIKQST